MVEQRVVGTTSELVIADRRCRLVGLPVYLSNRLQSVLNATALVYWARKYDHVTSQLQELHWLRVLQQINYKLAVLTFRCLHGQAPSYLTDSLLRTADVESCRHLRSAMTNLLVVPTTRCSTIDERSFAASASRVWNSLPSRITSSSSFTTFKRQLKTELFITLRAKLSGTVYCNRSCLWVCGGRCLWRTGGRAVSMLPR